MATKRLKNGQIVTDELLAALAEEAEGGYSPSQIRPRAAGRPSLGAGELPRVQFRVEPATYEALLARARAENRGVSEVARIALEKFLSVPPQPANADTTTAIQETQDAAASLMRNSAD